MRARLDHEATTATGWQRLILRHRGLVLHLALFTIGVVEFGVLNLMSTDAGWWLVWPIGVWLVLLAGHAGAFLLPGRPIPGVLVEERPVEWWESEVRRVVMK